MNDPLFLELQAALAGRYSLLEELGRGGMGVVYLAREVRLDRLVAIKLLPPQLAGIADRRERFLREARTAARLTHPNIIPVYTADESGALAWFVMAYVKGETLAARVARLGPRPPDEVARIARQAAFALAYAHAQGVIHRDVKPENIMIEDGTGRVMLADFGIAQTGEAVTDPARRVGTPKWMAPEQLAGQTVDARADLYALGLVMKFAAGELPPRMHAIVVRSTAPVPEQRYPSAEDMATALEPAGEQSRIAPGIERWIDRGETLRPSDALLAPVMLAPMTVLLELMFDGLLSSGAGRYDQNVALLVSLIGPLVLWAGLRGTDLRATLRAGFRRRDLIEALRRKARELDERAIEDGTLVRPNERRVRSALAGLLVAGGYALARLLAASAGGDPIALAAAGYTVFAGVLAAWRLARSAREPSRQKGLDLRAMFWSSKAGRLLERVLSWRLRPRPSTEAITAQPTEIGLVALAEEMFERLPAAHRRALGNVPALLERLESRARDARGNGNEQDLAAAVTALENVRLDLLRLTAADSRGLTEDLDAVKRLGEQVDAIG